MSDRKTFTISGKDGETATFVQCRWCRFTRGGAQGLKAVEGHERIRHMPELVTLASGQAIADDTAAAAAANDDLVAAPAPAQTPGPRAEE